MNKKEKERRTPITDGDARPDMHTDPEPGDQKKKAKKTGGEKTDKFSTERSSDVNSLEDYKDAKN